MNNSKNIKKRYLIFCEPCSFKKILESDQPDDLYIIPRGPVSRGMPKLDPVTKKTVVAKSQEQKTMCKCPQCGRGVTLKDLPDAYSKTYQEIDEREKKQQAELEKQKRIEDGKPHERNPDPDFDPNFMG